MPDTTSTIMDNPPRSRHQHESSEPETVIYLRWYESWIMRAAFAVTFVLICAYAASILISVQTVNSISNISYDPEVANALGDHLKIIKDYNKLNQQVLVERIDALLKARPNVLNDAASLRNALNDITLDELNASQVAIRPQAFEPVEGKPLTEWLSPTRLRVGTYELTFDDNKLYDEFKRIETIRQRYQFIGAALDAEIKPTLLRANILILAIAFLGIIIVFTILIRRFKNAVGRVINGFMHWTEKDKSFRFGEQWRGELRLITAQFNTMADDVEENRRKSLYLEKIASWQTIARKLAHEIKNPLTPIQMMVSQLSRKYTGGDSDYANLLTKAQTIITEEVTSLRRMVDHFSEFARLPTPQLRYENIKPTVQHVCDLQQAAFPQHKITFACQEEALFCDCDPGLIRQVVLNLIKNAAEACGDRPSNIAVKLGQDVKHINIVISDDGPGIPEELQKNIFEAYFTTKHSGPTPGMGLGLAICQKIVMDHDGELLVKSKPQDTQFTIRLPKKAKEQ